MENFIKKNLEKILSDEKLLKQFLEINDVNDLGEFFKKENSNFSKQEIIEYLYDLIKKSNIISEEKLDNISGGTLKEKLLKFLSVSLASLSLTSSIVNLTNVPVKAAETQNTLSNKKIFGIASAVGAGTLGAAALGALIWYYNYKNSIYNKITDNGFSSIYNKITDNGFSSTHNKISTDEWFKRLGGTDEDIKNYALIAEDFNIENKTEEDFDIIIDKDILRTSSFSGDNSSFSSIGKRILKIYSHSLNSENSNKYYTQGMSYYLNVVFTKFLGENGLVKPKMEQEGKIYYIFSKMMDSVDTYYFDKSDKIGINEIKYRLNEYIKQNPKYKNFFDNLDVFNTKIINNYLVSGIEYIFDINQSIKIWDNIISDDSMLSTKGFNNEKVKDVLSIVINKCLSNTYDSLSTNNIDDFLSKKKPEDFKK